MWSAVCRASSVAILILVIAPALTTPAAYAGPLLLPAIQPHVNVPIQPRVNIPVQLHAIVRQGPAIQVLKVPPIQRANGSQLSSTNSSVSTISTRLKHDELANPTQIGRSSTNPTTTPTAPIEPQVVTSIQKSGFQTTSNTGTNTTSSTNVGSPSLYVGSSGASTRVSRQNCVMTNGQHTCR